MRISLIVPSYNVESFLKRCIASCLDQDLSMDDYEIIIVNDGSTDNTLQIAQSLCKNNNVKILNKDNGGLGSARNAGLNVAQGDYVWFIDSDDWISANCLNEVIMKSRVESCDVLCLMSSVYYSEDNIVPYVKFKSKDSRTGVKALKSFIDPGVPFYVFKRSFLINNQLHFVEGIYHEDSEFTPRALYTAKKVSYLSKVLYFIYPNPNSITRSVNYKRLFDKITVCKRLDSYIATDVRDEDAYLFSRLIARTLNAAFREMSSVPDNIHKAFSDAICEEKALLKHYLKSKKCKYLLIGLLLSVNKMSISKMAKYLFK